MPATIEQISEQIRKAGLNSDVNLDLIPGGQADDEPDADFDADELARGIKHEMEHTDDKKIAAEIAKDHIKEDPKYYEKLEKAKLSNIDYETVRLMGAS